MKEINQIQVNSETKSIEKITNFVEKILKENKICSEAVEEILVAVDEAVTNVIRHSYKDKKDGVIQLHLVMKDNKIIISLFDDGMTFEPKRVPLPIFSKNIDKRTLGGMGIYLMKQFMDEVTFYFKGTNGRKKNEVKMVKFLK